jgi:hypothetical protein
MALVICTLFVVAPFVIKSYINKNGEELAGRKLQLTGLYHNPLTGYTRLRDFKMFEQQDTAIFMSFDTLVINLDLYKLLGGTFSISEISLVNPEIEVIKEDTLFNYADLVARFTESDSMAQEPESESTLDIELNNISMINGVVNFHNLVTERQWQFDDIDINIPGLYFDHNNTDVDLDLTLRDGGELLSNTEYNNQEGSYRINLELTEINLAPLKANIKDHLRITDFGGSLDANLVISGKLGYLDQLTLNGTVDIHDYFFDDIKGQRFLAGEKVTMEIEEIIPLIQSTTIGSINFQNPSFFYELNVDSTDNIRSLLISNQTENSSPELDTATSIQGPDTATSRLDLVIKKLLVQNGTFDFKDHNPESPFEYIFSDINIDINNISPEDTTRLNLDAKAPENGEISLAWEGDFFDLNHQSFTLKTNIPGLPAFSPYTISFFDVPIENGTFNYISTNHINNGKLSGLHTIMASGITLGEKKGFPSLYDVPIKIGLYLLEDKNGDIHLEIPVEGTTDDPNFRYSKIIVDAIVNGIVKLVTSPIGLIGKLVGAGDDFSELTYNPLYLEITPDLETKLNYMAEALAEKPQLKFKMVQHYDQEQASKDLAVHLVKRDYYKKIHGNTSIEDFYAIDNIEPKDSEFIDYVSDKSKQSIDNQQALINACMQLKEKEVLQASDTIASGWNKLITSYLINKSVPENTIQIEPSDNDKGVFEYELEAELLEEGAVMAIDSVQTSE